jgi:hypothetical protein
MANAKNTQDGAKVLSDLSPYEIYEYALYVPMYEEPWHYQNPYRRYKTIAHAKSAAKSLGKDVKYYKFNFETECWEEYDA